MPLDPSRPVSRDNPPTSKDDFKTREELRAYIASLPPNRNAIIARLVSTCPWRMDWKRENWNLATLRKTYPLQFLEFYCPDGPRPRSLRDYWEDPRLMFDIGEAFRDWQRERDEEEFRTLFGDENS